MSSSRRVSRVATWAGWCNPCEREDRPLVLTRSGPGGLTSWLSGLSDDDRLLLLTCRVCGQWQFVPAREEDDPEILLEDDSAEDVALERPVLVQRPVSAERVLAADRIDTVPQSVPQSVTQSAFSPEAVEAASRVLAAARAQTQRSVAPRTAPRAHARTSGRTAPRGARRTLRMAPSGTPLPAVLGLPTGTHQVVLAAAS